MSETRAAARSLSEAKNALAWAGAKMIAARVEGHPELDALITAAREDVGRMMGEVDTMREILLERG